MKYLKLYEDHGKLYYGSLTKGGLYDFGYINNIINIDQSVVNSVKDLITELGLGFTVSVPSTYLTRKKYIRILLPDSFSSRENEIKIQQFDDEWFNIDFSSSPFSLLYRYYRCDQVEGLLQCLKDNLKV